MVENILTSRNQKNRLVFLFGVGIMAIDIRNTVIFNHK